MSLGGALLLMGSVWSVLLLGASSAPRVGREAAVLGSYGLATLIVAATGAAGRPQPGRMAAALGLGVLVGLASWPGWLVVLRSVFEWIGLGLPAPPCAGHAVWLAAIALAPVFEELLYRECLLGALRPRVGTALSVVATSVLFALPHLGRHAVVATLLVGLVLGSVRVASGSVAPCVGVHAGLNLGAWLATAPWSRGGC